MISKRRDGLSLQVVVDGPSYEGATNGRVHYIDASAILGDGELHVFLTNRSVDEAVEVCVAVADRAVLSRENAELLTGPAPKAANSFEEGNVIKATPFEEVEIVDGQAKCELPPLSFAAMTLNLN
jgi:alpha-L-arabinofuranosidase